jgi:hypothetical protein
VGLTPAPAARDRPLSQWERGGSSRQAWAGVRPRQQHDWDCFAFEVRCCGCFAMQVRSAREILGSRSSMLEFNVRQHSFERLRQPPIPLPSQNHHRWYQNQTHYRGIQRDRHDQTQTDDFVRHDVAL